VTGDHHDLFGRSARQLGHLHRLTAQRVIVTEDPGRCDPVRPTERAVGAEEVKHPPILAIAIRSDGNLIGPVPVQVADRQGGHVASGCERPVTPCAAEVEGRQCPPETDETTPRPVGGSC